MCFVCLGPIFGFAQNVEQSPDTVVVCAPDLLPAAQPWIEYRQVQGHELAFVSGEGTKEEIKRSIRSIADRSKLKFIVLIGDAPSTDIKTRSQVATHHVESQVIRRWGAEPTFATDSYYADIDEDGVPDVAIGRICADTSGELSTIVKKILAYEESADVGSWRRRVNFIAGVGGFGMLADKILETTAKKFITDGIPPEYRTSMTQASWRSPYSPDPRLFQAQTIERMNEGCLAWIYLGHGRKRELDYYRVPDGGLPIFSARQVPKVSARKGSPIAVFLSCYTGAFDSDPDCLAEELLSAPGGPVAVISGASVTMPYAMTVMGNAMLHELFVQQRATLGEVVLQAKRELAKPTDDVPKGIVDQLAKVISPNPELLNEERAEHIRLFHLIGDPLLRVRYPKKVMLDVAEYGTSGESFQVSGTSEIDGPCVLELVCRRDRMTFKPPTRGKFHVTQEWLSSLQETYAKANNTVWTAQRAMIRNGKFTATLSIPKEAVGLSHVRVYVQNERDFGMGSSDVYLRKLLPVETPTSDIDDAENFAQEAVLAERPQ